MVYVLEHIGLSTKFGCICGCKKRVSSFSAKPCKGGRCETRILVGPIARIGRLGGRGREGLPVCVSVK